MIKSELCELLNITYPVVQGGMAWIADAGLAAAVSNAGGLGMISAMNSNGEQIREQIRKARKLTDKPFGVNIMLMSPYVKEAVDVVCEEKVAVVSTGAGNPSVYMEQMIAAGIQVMPVVPSVAIAKMVAKKGAVAVVAEGGESGGHVGDLTTMTLVPQVADAVSIPVVAAGGIADGRGMAAALMLGACAIQMGTRFLTAQECPVHENYKEKVLKAKDIETIVTGKRLGHPVRSLKTPFSKMFFQKEYDSSISNEELEKLGAGSLRMAALDGDLEKGSFMCGQIAGLVTERSTCAEIIRNITAEAEEILRGTDKWVK